MGQHVVHLPGDTPPLRLPGLLGAALLVCFQPLRPLAERGDQFAPDAQVQSPPERDDREQEGGEADLEDLPPAGLTSGNMTPAATDISTTATRARPLAREAAVPTATSPAPRASGENTAAATTTTKTVTG